MNVPLKCHKNVNRFKNNKPGHKKNRPNSELAIYNKKTSKIYETFVVYNPDYNPDEVKKKGRRES